MVPRRDLKYKKFPAVVVRDEEERKLYGSFVGVDEKHTPPCGGLPTYTNGTKFFYRSVACVACIVYLVVFIF